MNNIDYQQECGLVRYPFRDGATLVWTSGSTTGELSNSVFRDASITSFSGTTSFALSSIVMTGGVATINIGSYAITVPANTGINTYTAKDANALVCLDIDNDALSQLADGTYTFDGSCVLCLSCVKLLSPNVSRISLTNTLPVGSESIFDDQVKGSGLALVEGTNVGFSVSGKVDVDVNRGLGAGQYDACGNPLTRLYTINNLTPDAKGNYLLGNDFCYSTYRTAQGLHLKNTCKPECTSDDILNTANYYNRVGDLANQLSTYVGSTNSNYNSWLTNIETLEANKSAIALNYVLASSSTSANKVNQYHNIGVGLYFPHFKSTSTNLQVFYNTSEFQLVSKSFYVSEKNNKRVLPDFTPNGTIAAEVAACQSNRYYGFVLQEPIADGTNHHNLGSSLYDVTFRTTAFRLGSAGFVLPLNPASFNFSVKYTEQIIRQDPTNLISTVLSKLLKFDITFIDPTGSTGAVTLNTNAGSFGTIQSSSTILNGFTSNYIGAGFANVNMVGTRVNHYLLTVSCPPTLTGTQNITFSASGPSGKASKTIAINFL